MILAATILYVVTAALCLRAAHAADRATLADRPSPKVIWLAIACFFAALAVWRWTGAEEAIRTALRAEIVARGEYGLRQNIQAPLAAVALLALATLGLWVVIRMRKLGPRKLDRTMFWARAATFAMAGLVAVRLVSLHATDTLIYSGPHLNRVIDPALALLVAVQAAMFAHHVRRLKGR